MSTGLVSFFLLFPCSRADPHSMTNSSFVVNPKCSDSRLRPCPRHQSSGGLATMGSRLEVAFSILTLRNGSTIDSLLSRFISTYISVYCRFAGALADNLRSSKLAHSGGKDYLVLTEPLLHRLKTKEVDVDLIRVQKMDDGEHCDFFW